MIQSDYRQTFAAPASAQSYDERVYAPGASAEILWRTEARILQNLARQALQGRKNPAYLDFACGTGRVLSLLESEAETATGIDVSASMLERAGQKCRRATLICADITARSTPIEGRYDLITSFRFLTNAEDGLRSRALEGLRERLKDDGTLIVNTHGNPWSHRAVLLPYHWAKDAAQGRPLFGYLSNRQARRLLHGAGFRIRKVIGMGFVPQKLSGMFSAQTVERIENGLAGRRFVQAFGLNQIFVCEKR